MLALGTMNQYVSGLTIMRLLMLQLMSLICDRYMENMQWLSFLLLSCLQQQELHANLQLQKDIGLDK